MKLTIRPPIEIDVDGDKCNGKTCDGSFYCRFREETERDYDYCNLFKVCLKCNLKKGDDWDFDRKTIRCEACLDAEKETANATVDH